MFERGRVVKAEGNLAQVEFEALPECARCGACHRASVEKMQLEVGNPIGVKMGGLVEVEISERTIVLSYLVVYGIPILFFFLGLVAGSFISETAGIMAGVVCLILGFLSVKLIDRYIVRQKRFRSRIVRVIE